MCSVCAYTQSGTHYFLRPFAMRRIELIHKPTNSLSHNEWHSVKIWQNFQLHYFHSLSCFRSHWEYEPQTPRLFLKNNRPSIVMDMLWTLFVWHKVTVDSKVKHFARFAFQCGRRDDDGYHLFLWPCEETGVLIGNWMKLYLDGRLQKGDKGKDNHFKHRAISVPLVSSINLLSFGAHIHSPSEDELVCSVNEAKKHMFLYTKYEIFYNRTVINELKRKKWCGHWTQCAVSESQRIDCH